MEKDLDCNEGLHQVLEATAATKQQHPLILTAAHYDGIKWRHHMKELVADNTDEIMNGHDGLIGSHLFMVAAMRCLS